MSRAHALLAVLWAVCVPHVASDGLNTIDYGLKWQKIVQLVDHEQFTVAYAQLIDLVGDIDHSQDVMAIQLLGAVSLKLEKHENAWRYMRQVFQLGRMQGAAIYANYILALLHSGRLDEAVQVSLEGLQLHQGHVTLLRTIAMLYSIIKSPDTAQIYSELCLRDNGPDVFYHCMAAVRWGSDDSSFVQSLVSAIEVSKTLDLNHLHLLVDLGHQYVSRGASAELSYSPLCQEIIKNILFNQGGVEVALEISGKLYEWLKHEPLYLLDFGVLQYFYGDYARSVAYCHAAANLANDSYIIHACIGTAAIYERDQVAVCDLAITSLLTAIELISNNKKSISSEIFSVNILDLKFNLLGALYSFGRFDDCVTSAVEFLNIPPYTTGGAILLSLSLVDWSRGNALDFIDPLERDLVSKNKLSMLEPNTLSTMLRNLQAGENVMLLPTASSCASSLHKAGMDEKNSWLFASKVLSEAIESIEQKNKAVQSTSCSAIYRRTNSSTLILITQFFLPAYEEQNVDEPWKDMLLALSNNVINNCISHIVLFCDRDYEVLGKLRLEFGNNVTFVIINKRLSFKDAFLYANENLKGKTVIIANSDIFFEDDGLSYLGDSSTLLFPKTFLALSKWTLPKGGTSETKHKELQLRIESQDAWIFQPPVADDIVAASDFYLGAPRCDNVLAYLLSRSGYLVLNPAFAIKAIEIDSTERVGSLYKHSGSVLGIGKNVLLSDRFVF